MSVPVSAALRVLVVDDEALARQVLREYLEGIAGVEILGECANGFDAVKAIAERSPDLVFLDVQMPKLDGFEVLELAGRATPVVFVTAYDEFAVRAFEVHAVDYLLKPISPERVSEAIERARARLGRPAEPVPVAALRAEGRMPAPLERILVRDGTRVHVIDLDDLDFVQAQDDYVCFHAAGKEYLKEQPLAEVEELLEATRFVRIHRSFILSRTGYQRLTALM
jgi:two-component system, LytTR family, response regulator